MGPRVLVVDDDPDIADYLSSRLEAHGYEVAGDGSRFLFVSRFPLQDNLSEERVSLVLILNWFTEVEEKLGGGR